MDVEDLNEINALTTPRAQQRVRQRWHAGDPGIVCSGRRLNLRNDRRTLESFTLDQLTTCGCARVRFATARLPADFAEWGNPLPADAEACVLEIGVQFWISCPSLAAAPSHPPSTPFVACRVVTMWSRSTWASVRDVAGRLLRRSRYRHWSPGTSRGQVHARRRSEVHERCLARRRASEWPSPRPARPPLPCRAENSRGKEDERAEVLGAFAQRRHRIRHPFRFDVEVGAETCAVESSPRARIGRRNHADVRRRISAPPTARIGVPGELGAVWVAAERHLADSSRNNVPPAAASILPLVCVTRPGKGSALVTEELALEQTRGNRGAVDHDKALMRSEDQPRESPARSVPSRCRSPQAAARHCRLTRPWRSRRGPP